MHKPEQRDPNRCAAHVEDLEHRHATSPVIRETSRCGQFEDHHWRCIYDTYIAAIFKLDEFLLGIPEYSALLSYVTRLPDAILVFAERTQTTRSLRPLLVRCRHAPL